MRAARPSRRCLSGERGTPGRRGCAWRRLRRDVVGPHPFLAVGDLVRPRGGTDEEVLKTIGGKLYWRFLMIGARYCTQSFADCSAPNRDAACTAPQMKVIGLAKLLMARMALAAP